MLRSVLLLSLALFIQHSVAEEDIPGKLIGTRTSFAAFSNFRQECELTGHYVQCNSCTSYMVCLDGQKLGNLCPEHKPYCNNGECSAVPDYSSCPVSSLSCTGEGFYPDPKACQFYHYCEAAGMVSDVYECPTNYVFNTKTTFCRQKLNESDCESVRCDPDRILQRYGSSDNYFGICRDGDILMSKCDHFYALFGKRCELKCKDGEGRFPHPDVSKFYTCLYYNSMLYVEEVECPGGKVFLPERFACGRPPA